MSENIASSTWLGARPSFSQTRPYSSGVSPRATASSSDGVDTCHGLEDDHPVRRARECVDRVLGMRHEAEHVALLVAHPGDPALGAVVVFHVAQDDLAASL